MAGSTRSENTCATFWWKIEQARGTQFGDCVSKVIICLKSLPAANKFRGVRDEFGRLQAGAIVELFRLFGR